MYKIYFDKENEDKISKLFNPSCRYESSDKIEEYKNAVVLPPSPYKIDKNLVTFGIINENGIYVKESGRFNLPFEDYTLPENIPYDDREVIYCGNLSTHYGHFLLEATTRLYYYLENRDTDKYLCFSAFRKELPAFAEDFLKLLDIPLDKIIPVTDFKRFKKILLPQSSYYDNLKEYSYSDKFVKPFQIASAKIKPAEYKKVYLTRTHYRNTQVKCFNERELEKVFNKNGFKSIQMEKLSISEQIAIIKGADEVAGIIGTALHNVVFADKPKNVIILKRNEDRDCQSIINEAAGANSYVVKAYHNFLPVNHSIGPFVVGMTKEMKTFMQEYGFKNFDIDFKPEKFIQDFVNQYLKIYSNEEYYSRLVNNNKDKIDANVVISILKMLTDFDLKTKKASMNLFTLKNIFSVTNEYIGGVKRKIITILGIKIKLKKK